MGFPQGFAWFQHKKNKDGDQVTSSNARGANFTKFIFKTPVQEKKSQCNTTKKEINENEELGHKLAIHYTKVFHCVHTYYIVYL